MVVEGDGPDVGDVAVAHGYLRSVEITPGGVVPGHWGSATHWAGPGVASAFGAAAGPGFAGADGDGPGVAKGLWPGLRDRVSTSKGAG